MVGCLSLPPLGTRMTDSDKTALITGASAGIGAAFARVFASHRFNLVLVARRDDKLNALADEIRAQHNVDVTVIKADLAGNDSPQTVVDDIKSRGIHLDVLVNNAGYAIKGSFAELSWREHMAMQQVMLTGYTQFCHLLIPAMKENQYGRIINVSSLAGFFPPMKGSLYGPIKSYVMDMTIALDYELRDSGIHCTVICPGWTRTEFQDSMGISDAISGLPDFIWQSAQEVARQGYQAVMQGKVLKINGILNRILVAIFGLMPKSLFLYLGRHINVIPD